MVNQATAQTTRDSKVEGSWRAGPPSWKVYVCRSACARRRVRSSVVVAAVLVGGADKRTQGEQKTENVLCGFKTANCDFAPTFKVRPGELQVSWCWG